MLTKRFPAALRAIDALAPLHSRCPSAVEAVAAIIEECLQAYGRCLLATAGTVLTDMSARASDASVREAETHMAWRTRVREALDEMSVDASGREQAALSKASHNVDHLMYTVDEVLATRNVHCVAVASGIHS